MRLAFSTLGCPAWELDRVAAAAVEHGYEALELRALGGSLDLLSRPEFQPLQVASTRAWLEDKGLSVCCVDTSCRFDCADNAERAEQEEVAYRYSALASGLGARLIRVFPDKVPPGETREATRDRIAASLRRVAQQLPSGVHVGLETHGDFAACAATAEIVADAAHSSVGIIWDAANSTTAGDIPARDVASIAPWLLHVHLRDARPREGAELWQPVLAGRGNVPFDEVFDALAARGYDGYVCFEWEKYWHPELEEPEIALPDFAAAAKIQLQRIRRSGTADAR